MVAFSDKQGMTLVELIYVIAIIAIIVLIAIPKIDFLLNYKEKNELIEFKKDIVYLRNSAICEVVLYKLHIQPKDNCYTIYKFNNMWELVKSKKLESGLKFSGGQGNEIIFNPTGAPSKGQSIYLLNRKDKKIKITITPATGKVNIYFDGD